MKGLADESEVVIAAGGIGDGGAAVGGDAQVGQIGDATAVNSDRTAPGVPDADGISRIAAAVDVAERSRATIGRRRGNAAVARRRGIRELHDSLPSLIPAPSGGFPPTSYGIRPRASIARRSRL